MMKKTIVILIGLLIFSLNVFASPIKRIVFFGDSLTDNGNLYKTLLWIIPKSPPYYSGRFSNGPVWSDWISDYFLRKYNVDSLNYAVGGATTVSHNLFSGHVPYRLDQEINHYLFQSTIYYGKRSESLFVFWIGANDYIDGQNDIDAAVSAVVNKIAANVNSLIKHGGKYFLIINLPDLAKAPFAKAVSFSDNLHALSVAHNLKLSAAVRQLQTEHPDIKISYFDVNAFFSDIATNIEQYNQKYGTHLKNMSEACWKGGYTLQDPQQHSVDSLSHELHHRMNTSDSYSMAQTILHSKDLAEVYRIQQLAAAGVTPCEVPDAYAFWDAVHPTRVVHKIISDVITQKLLDEKFVD